MTAARDRAKQELRDFVGTLGGAGGCELRRRTDYGDPFLTILRIAQLSAYDLIVATLPHGGRARPDNVTLSLLHTAKVPLLAIPPAVANSRGSIDLGHDLRRVILPGALCEQCPALVERASSLARAAGAELEQLAAGADLEASVMERAARRDYELFALPVRGAELGSETRDERAERLLFMQACPTLCVRCQT